MSSSPANNPAGASTGPPPASEAKPAPHPSPVKHPTPPSPWADENRRSLLGPTTLVLMLAAVAAVLVLIFPGENYNDPRYTARADGLSLAYLRAILRVRPHDPGLRVALARQQALFGQLEEALATLLPITSGRTSFLLEAELLALDIERRQFFAATPGGTSRDRARARVLRRIERILAAGPARAVLDRLASASLEMGQPGLAARIHMRIAQGGGPRAGHHYAEAGRWFLAAGDHAGAAEALHRAAMSLRAHPRRAVPLAIQSLDILISLGRAREALDRLEILRQAIPGSLELLDRGVSLAIALGDLPTARRLALLRLPLAVGDRRRLTEHRQIEVALNGVQAALQVARAIVELTPNDPVERRRLAEIAEWGKDWQTALDSWLWLARRGDDDAIRRGLFVARTLLHTERLIDLYRIKGTRGRLSFGELEELVGALESLGKPEQATGAVEDLGDRTDRRVWGLLARLLHRSGQPRKALGVWAETRRRFGPRLADVMTEARLLWSQGTPGDARTLLRRTLALADEDATLRHEFLRLLGDLAWKNEWPDDATLAYQRLWESGQATPDETARLLQLLTEKGNDREILAFAKKASAHAPGSRFLLIAMQAAFRLRDWDELEALLTRGDRDDPAYFHAQEPYWLLRAELARERRRPQDVETAYARALAANPLSHAARLGWLWYALERADRPRLQALVNAWHGLAAIHAPYAPGFALAHDHLGQLELALPFYDRAARATPADLDLLEAYADALERAGRADGALRLRGFVLRGRREAAGPVLATWSRSRSATAARSDAGPGLQPVRLVNFAPSSAAHEEGAARSARPVLAYTRLLQRLRGTGEAWPLTRTLLAMAGDRRDVQDFGLEVEQRRQNLPGARRWVSRMDRTGGPTAAQRVALAMTENDREVLAWSLRERPGGLSLADRVTIADRLGRRDLARRELENALRRPLRPEERAALMELHRRLEDQDAMTVAADASAETAGPVTALAQRAFVLGRPVGPVRWGAHAGHLRFAPRDATQVTQPATSRADMGVEAKLPLGRLHTGLRLGATADAQTFVPSVAAELVARLPELSRGSELAVGAAWGETPLDGGLMRLLGRRDRVDARLHVALGAREYVAGGIELRRDGTRTGDFLGQSRLLRLELGTQATVGTAAARAYVQGVAASADRAMGLPSMILPALGPGTSIEGFVPAHYTSAIVGASLASGPLFGNLVTGPAFRYSLDAAAGWLEPAGRAVVRLDLGLAVRFLPNHAVGGRAFLFRSQGGRAGQTDRGVQLRYEIAWH